MVYNYFIIPLRYLKCLAMFACANYRALFWRLVLGICLHVVTRGRGGVGPRTRNTDNWNLIHHYRLKLILEVAKGTFLMFYTWFRSVVQFMVPNILLHWQRQIQVVTASSHHRWWWGPVTKLLISSKKIANWPVDPENDISDRQGHISNDLYMFYISRSIHDS